MSYFPYTTPGQKASVKGMDKVASAVQSKFVVALGDNFYHEGVTDENSDRFDKTWDSLYTPASLQTPWYVIAGNHGTIFVTLNKILAKLSLHRVSSNRLQRKRVCSDRSFEALDSLELSL